MLRPRRLFAALLAAIAFASSADAQNLIINGSFETNTAGVTSYNLSNAAFNATVGSATAFGTAEEIDLITFGSPYGSPPQDGSWKLAIHTQLNGTFYDAFSFNLSSSV